MVEPARARRTFAPVVLLGLASGALVAVAGSRQGVDVDADPGAGVAASVGLTGPEAAYDMPLVTSLALVALAAWGVVLVTRGRVRRAVVAVGVVAAAGALVAVLAAWSALTSDLRTALEQVGAGDAEVSHTGWYAAAAVGSVLLVAASLVALRLVPHWPEMGSRYDAPAGRSGAAASGTAARPVEELSGLDLWRALDEGHDPTQEPAEQPEGDTPGPDRGTG